MNTGNVDERVAAIEDAFVANWSLFGHWRKGTLYDEDGVLWFETPIAHLPYNMVIRTRIAPDADADAIIDKVASRFRDRAVPYLWAHRPSDTPADLGRHLARRGLDLVETVTGMDLDLDTWEPGEASCDARIVVADHIPGAIGDYVELTRTYWSVPGSERELLRDLHTEWSGDGLPGVRFLAYRHDQPIAKLFLNTSEVPARVAVYGVATKPEARGTGVATALMTAALRHARELGAKRCVLHSTDVAVSLYRRMGFTERCSLHGHGRGPLFGTHDH